MSLTLPKYEILGRKINSFIQYVEDNWLTRNKKRITKRINSLT